MPDILLSDSEYGSKESYVEKVGNCNVRIVDGGSSSQALCDYADLYLDDVLVGHFEHDWPSEFHDWDDDDEEDNGPWFHGNRHLNELLRVGCGEGTKYTIAGYLKDLALNVAHVLRKDDIAFARVLHYRTKMVEKDAKKKAERSIARSKFLKEIGHV